jgi:hypothetical protein
MTKLVSTLAILILGLVALGAVASRIAVVLNAAVPVIAVTAFSAALLRWVWWRTRGW